MQAYVTLLTSNNYASGALVLAHSLRASQTTKHLAVLTTAAVSKSMRDRLANVFDSVIEIGAIDSHATKQLELLGRPELGITLSKIHVFNQTQFDKVVFLDADTLVLRNVDHLFDTAANGSLDDQDRNTRFAASPDAGWPDCFNSGVFVCKPKYDDYRGLIELANTEGSFDGGDQGLLNSYFSGWSTGSPSNRLPFVYNTTPTVAYSYAPAYQQYKDRLAIVHFIGRFKPWHWLRFADGQVFPRNHASKDSIDLVQQWWSVWDMFVGGKPSDIHEVAHEGYEGDIGSQWDSIGLDRQPFAPSHEKPPHYDGWFQPYDMAYTQKKAELVHPGHGHHEHHHHDNAQLHHEQYHHHHQHEKLHHPHQDHREEHHHGSHHHDHHDHHQEEHHHSHQEWHPPVPPTHWQEEHNQHQHQHHHHHHTEHHHHQEQHHTHHQEHQHHHGHHGQREEHHEHHHQQHQQHEDHGPQHQEPPPPVHYNPHHLTDYHYYVPPPPPKVPEMPEPVIHRLDHHDHTEPENSTEQSHPKDERNSTNPHHLTDYRYRLPAAMDSPKVSIEAASTFREILPPPQGLPDLYYENAWDKPEDPRKMHPIIEPVSVVVLSTEDRDTSSVYPSGKTHPVFPWETASQSRTGETNTRRVTRKYYNYTAHHEARTRQREQDAIHRLELEEAALAKIQQEENERLERDRAREEAHRRATGHHALESFRLVNAWDVDVGVQMSILKKTEHKQQRKPRSRKSSGALRRGYTLDDTLALEAKQRQEQYEADLVRQQIEEEERFLREQEEARILEEAARQARIRKQRLAEKRERETREQVKRTTSSTSSSSTSSYTFRNAWDPPGVGLIKKKMSIEDEEVEMALPLRPQRRDERRELTFASFGNTESQTQGSRVDGSVSIETAFQTQPSGARYTGESATTTTSIEVDEEEETRGRSRSTTSSARTVIGQTDESETLAAGTILGVKSLKSVADTASSSGTSMALTTQATTTKMTPPGAIRFVKTTTTTTIIRKKIINGKEVESTTTTSSTGDYKEMELPPGPRKVPYFTGSPRSASITRSQEPSRLGAARQTATKTTTTSSTSSSYGGMEKHDLGMVGSRVVTNQHGTSSSSSSKSKIVKTSSSTSNEAADIVQSIFTQEQAQRTDDSIGHMTEKTVLTSTGTSIGKETSTYESIAQRRESKALPALGIDTQRALLQEQQRERMFEKIRLDLGRDEATAAAVEKAKEILSRNPRATAISTKVATKNVGMYAGDPNLQAATTTTSTSHPATKGKERVMVLKDQDVVEETSIEEDPDELEYFYEQHTHAALPIGSPYMPSTPLIPGVHPRYPFSGFSSRAASRPVSRPASRPPTPGSVTPSRYGPSTPKLGAFATAIAGGDKVSKKAQLIDSPPMSQSSTMAATSSSTAAFGISGFSSSIAKDRRQSVEPDSGFSNYRIEWNWSELLGKKPRHWNADEGEYDPYNALSTHGSMADSDEDDGHHLLDSSEEESEEEEEQPPTGSSSSGRNRFAQGEDNELARETGYVIRDGKIARRRSSMALERKNL